MKRMPAGECAKRIFFIVTTTVLMVLCMAIFAQATQTQVAAVQTVEVGIPVEEKPDLFLTRSMPTHGDGKIAVFLIDFPDYPNDNPAATQEYYDKLYFSGGVRNYWANITVAEFFEQESYGKLNIDGQVFDWYTAKHKRSYYDNRKAELIKEAAEYYLSQGVDFSQFDGDGDGTIDAITYHFAGEYSSNNQEDSWYSGVCYSTNPVNGWGEIGGLKFTTMVQVYDGASTGTSNLISVICHELMHTLGMLDLYGDAYFALSPVRDLMCENEYAINPYTKILLGWIDTVQVITGQADDVRLNVYGNKTAGDVVIVTDSFDSFFDEFYVVAYRSFYQFTTPTVWHVDARISEDGSTFLYDNMSYDPRPDKKTGHNDGDTSPYLFIEELSADFETNYVILGKNPASPEVSGFGADSVLGPNSIPSSDTHDGEYTGICIHNFVEYNKEYVTFDVVFLEDTAAPVLTTKEDELKFTKTITLTFNESIYQGENWDNIQVTDLNGATIKATILRPHYPYHEVEITFLTDAYIDGYYINLPEGAIRDSAGNTMAALTLSATKEDYFFPADEEMLPNPGYNRNNDHAYFFQQEDSIVVITGLWAKNEAEENVLDAKIEFMRLANDGTVILQKIVDNPFKNGEILNVTQTRDGCYIFLCRYEGSTYYNLLFCMDQDGNIKWTNADSITESLDYDISWHLTDNGIRIIQQTHDNRRLVDIHSEDGSVEYIYEGADVPDYWAWNVMNLSEGKLLGQRIENGNVTVLIIDEKSQSVEKEALLTSDIGNPDYILRCQSNEDGTILLYCYVGEKRAVLLLDAQLNVIKTLRVSKREGVFQWIPNNGFVDFDLVVGNHENNIIHVSRYDRYLNKIWESDVVANFVYYYEISAGEIVAYRSMWEPERECYIDYYGSEGKFVTEHKHNLVHNGETSSTCRTNGISDYWQCIDCGCIFSDEGQTVVTDLKALELPLGEHSFGEWETVDEPTTKHEGIEVRTCVTCGAKEYSSIPMLPIEDETNSSESTDGSVLVTICIVAAICVFGIVVTTFVIRKKKSAK